MYVYIHMYIHTYSKIALTKQLLCQMSPPSGQTTARMARAGQETSNNRTTWGLGSRDSLQSRASVKRQVTIGQVRSVKILSPTSVKRQVTIGQPGVRPKPILVFEGYFPKMRVGPPNFLTRDPDS